MMRIKMSAAQAASTLSLSFYMAGFDIEVDHHRNQILPPTVYKKWGKGRINSLPLKSGAQKVRKVTVCLIDRPEDGVMHVRAQALSYARRPSKVGRPVVWCKSWTDGEYNKLAGLVCSGNLDQLLSYLAASGVPDKSTCQKVASALNRTESSVVSKLRDLRRKALVSGK